MSRPPVPQSTVYFCDAEGGYVWEDGAKGRGVCATLGEARFHAVRVRLERAIHFSNPELDRADREDCLSEGVLAVWSVLTDPTHPNYTTAQSATFSWLVQHGVFRARDFQRKERHRTHLGLDALVRDDETTDPTPLVDLYASTTLDDEETIQLNALFADLGRLPDRVLETAELLLTGMTQSQIARMRTERGDKDDSRTVVSRDISRVLIPRMLARGFFVDGRFKERLVQLKLLPADPSTEPVQLELDLVPQG